jgi:hypothetical protein
LLAKLQKLEDVQRQLQGALHGWLSQLQQQRDALVACFGLGDVEALARSAASDPDALSALNAAVSNPSSQTSSIESFLRMMLSPPSAPAASATTAPVSVAACVKMSRENLMYAAIGCRSILAREAASAVSASEAAAAAAASAVSASAGVRVAVESEIVQLKQQIQEQQQQIKQHEEQQLVTMKLYQVGCLFQTLVDFAFI